MLLALAGLLGQELAGILSFRGFLQRSLQLLFGAQLRWLGVAIVVGGFAAVAAASRLQAISPNMIVFVIHGLTFKNLGALGAVYC